MERTKRMLVVMLTSFGIFALLTFLTFSSYGQTSTQENQNTDINTNFSAKQYNKTVRTIQTTVSNDEMKVNMKVKY